MDIIRVPHPFEIVRVNANQVVINEGFVYDASTLQRYEVEDIIETENGKLPLQKVWQTAVPDNYSYTIKENETVHFWVEVEHSKPEQTSFLSRCTITMAKIVTTPEKKDDTNFSYTEIAVVRFNADDRSLSIKQYLNSDIFFFKWGEANSI
jgi:hypothetical protein